MRAQSLRDFFCVLFVGLGILSPGLAHSTGSVRFNSTTTYYVNYHFTGIAFGKAVKSVLIHTGALEVCPWQNYGQPFWVDEQNIEMKRNGDHFNARAVVTGFSSSAGVSLSGVMAQYWILFEDGSKQVTAPALIP